MAGFTEIRTGWDQAAVYVLIICGFVLLAGFVLMEQRIVSPMLDLSLFRRPDLTGATLAMLFPLITGEACPGVVTSYGKSTVQRAVFR